MSPLFASIASITVSLVQGVHELGCPVWGTKLCFACICICSINGLVLLLQILDAESEIKNINNVAEKELRQVQELYGQAVDNCLNLKKPD